MAPEGNEELSGQSGLALPLDRLVSVTPLGRTVIRAH